MVVDDDVHATMSGVERKIGQMESLVNNPLTGESSIAVEKNRHNLNG